MWLLACHDPVGLEDEVSPPPPGPGAPETLPGDSLPDPPDTGEEDPAPSDAAWIFDETRIHDIELSLDEASWDALDHEPYEWVHGDFAIDGIALSDVGVRLRGKVGSFRTLDGKPKFKIDFGEFEDQELSGLKSLSLNNAVVDCSYLKEALALSIFAEAGVAASRFGFARVSVNGEAYGLYVIIEVPDKRFLSEHWEDDEGNLYDGKYLYDWHTGNYTMVDFTGWEDGNFQLEEGEDVELADIEAITRALGSAGQEGWAAAVDPLVDSEELHRNWAAEQWAGHVDGYAMNRNNYRIYFDPEDGRAEIVPWDFDYAFYQDWEWGMSWSSPTGRLAAVCWADADCLAAQSAAVQALVEDLDVAGLLTRFDAWQALVDGDAHADPRRECGGASIDPAQERLEQWVVGRNDELRASWGF